MQELLREGFWQENWQKKEFRECRVPCDGIWKELLKEEMEQVCSLKEQGWNRVKDSLKIRAGRLDEEEMEALIRRENASLVVMPLIRMQIRPQRYPAKPAAMFRM